MSCNSSDVANNAVESSEVVHSDSVPVATKKEVAKDVARMQLPIYQGIDSFIQGAKATLTLDTNACDMIVSPQLFEKISA